jgi:sorting nexin-1/2
MSSDEEDHNPKDKTQAKAKDTPKEIKWDEEPEEEEDQGQEEAKLKDDSTGIVVKVDNGLLKDGGAFSKKYVVYDVIGRDKHGDFNVKRRYSEFAELRKKLTENWPGYFIPPIPEKKATGNTTPEFIKMRQHFLDHFMSRCARMVHIFYSEEMQGFLRGAGDVIKTLSNIKPLTPTLMFERNRSLFPEYDREFTEKVDKSVKKYFKTLESTIKFFQRFRDVAKNMNMIRSRFKTLKTQFLKYAVNDYKNKLKGDEVKKGVEEKYKDYQKTEKDDDLFDFMRNMKDVEMDLTSFLLIRNDLTSLKQKKERIQKQQEEANKTLSKVQSLESEEIKDGMFKKISKKDKVAQLTKEIEQCQSDIESLDKLRTFTFHLLNNHEFPILINDKRTTFARGVIGFHAKRKTAIEKEIDMIKMMHEHYRKY